MQLVLFIIYFWSWDTVRAIYDLCVTGDPQTGWSWVFNMTQERLEKQQDLYADIL